MAQLLEKTRRLLGEQADGTGAYPQTVWTDQYLIDGFNQAIDRLEREGFWFLIKKDTSITTVAGTNKYAIPAGLDEVIGIWVGDVLPKTELAPINSFDGDFENLVGGAAYKLESDGTNSYLYLYPNPTSALVVTIRAYWRQTQLSSGALTVTTAVPDRYHMFLIWSAVEYAHLRQEELNLAKVAAEKANDIYFDLWRNEIAPGGQEQIFMKPPASALR